MLGEMVAEQAGHALVQDVCTRAKQNGCNLLMKPPDKLKGALAVSVMAVDSICNVSRSLGTVHSNHCCAAQNRQQLLAGKSAMIGAS